MDPFAPIGVKQGTCALWRDRHITVTQPTGSNVMPERKNGCQFAVAAGSCCDCGGRTADRGCDQPAAAVIQAARHNGVWLDVDCRHAHTGVP